LKKQKSTPSHLTENRNPFFEITLDMITVKHPRLIFVLALAVGIAGCLSSQKSSRKGDIVDSSPKQVIKPRKSSGKNGSTEAVITLPSEWIQRFFPGKTDIDPTADPDQDGLTILQEYKQGTDPMDFSSGDNGAPDGWWVQSGLNPFSSKTTDSDNDGLTDADEFYYKTDPWSPDSKTAPGSTPPSPASGLSLNTLDTGYNQLTWKNNSTARGVMIERSNGGSVWKTVGVVAGNISTFTDTSSLPDIVYFYRVLAYN